MDPLTRDRNIDVATSSGNSQRRMWGPVDLVWAGVYLLNLPFAFGLGLYFTESVGRAGMIAGTLLLSVLGNRICVHYPKIRRLLIPGGILVGVSAFLPQLIKVVSGRSGGLPPLHLIAGLLAFEIGELPGVVQHDTSGMPGAILNEWGGLIVTLAAGALLMIFATLSGGLIRLMTPKRWWS